MEAMAKLGLLPQLSNKETDRLDLQVLLLL